MKNFLIFTAMLLVVSPVLAVPVGWMTAFVVGDPFDFGFFTRAYSYHSGIAVGWYMWGAK
jgi:hypothetical protein